MSDLASVRHNEWKTVPLGSIADVRLGKMLDKTKHTKGRPMPYLRNINVRWGTIDTSDLLEMYFEDDELERYGIQAGDVLVCEGGEPGRAAVWNGHLPDLKYQKALHRVRFREPYEPSLFVYLLELLAKTGALAPRFTGSTIKHFTRETLVELPVPVPPIDEQRGIVAEIEKQFTRLEAGVADLRRVHANLKRYRAAVLKAACEGKLVPTEAELACQEGRTYETGAQLFERILTERRKKWNGKGKYKEAAKPDTTNRPQLPEGWTWASPEQLSSGERYSLSIGPFGSNLKVSDYVTSGVPLVFVRNIRSKTFCGAGTVFVSKKKADELSAHQVSAGDVLITKMGDPPGDACLYPDGSPLAVITADCIKLRLTPGAVNPRFVVHAINSETMKTQIVGITKGVAQLKVSLARFGKIACPVPPFGEQQRIVGEVERRLSMVEELEAVVNANLQRATRLRQAILDRAFKGNLLTNPLTNSTPQDRVGLTNDLF